MAVKADKPRTLANPFTLWMLVLTTVVTGVLSYAVWRFTNARAEAEARVVFEFRVSQIEAAIRTRMQDYEHVLHSMSALFSSGTDVDAARWLNHFNLLRVEEKYPGFQGIGYSPKITRAERARVETQLRAQGAKNQTIRPEG